MTTVVVDAPKLGRMHHMVLRLVEELRSGGLDDASCERLQRLTYQTLVEIGSAVPDDLLRELGRVVAPVVCDHPTPSELRLLSAQLIGWLAGIAAAETFEDRQAAVSSD